MFEQLVFWALALGALGTSAMVVAPQVSRNPLYGALALVVSFIFIAGLYVLLLAHVMAVLQLLVYAGAIMVLFMFVIMLLNLRDDELEIPKLRIVQGVGIVAVAFIIAKVALVMAPGADALEAQIRTETTAMDLNRRITVSAKGDAPPPVVRGSIDAIPDKNSRFDADAAGAYVYNIVGIGEDGWSNALALGPVVVRPGQAVAMAIDDAQLAHEGPGSLWHYRVFRSPQGGDGSVVSWRAAVARNADGPAGATLIVDDNTPPDPQDYGTIDKVGDLLFRQFLFPFELASILLLVAVIGAVVLAKRRI